MGSCLPDSLCRVGWDFWCRNEKKGFLAYPSPTVGSCESSWSGKQATVCIIMRSESFPKEQEGISGDGLAWDLVVYSNTEFLPHRNTRRRCPGYAATSS